MGHRTTTGSCDHCAEYMSKLIVLKYFSLLFTLFEPYGAVFIMNSKIHLRKKSSNEYFKTISHYIISEFIHSRIHSRAFYKLLNLHGKDFQPLVQLFAARCYLPQKYFAIRQRTINKRMNKKSLAVLPGNPKCTMTSCWMVDLFMACC